MEEKESEKWKRINTGKIYMRKKREKESQKEEENFG